MKWTTPAREASEAGIETCGAPGDFLNWEEADWTLHSKARIIEVDSARGPCRREGKIQVYQMIDWQDHNFCMNHCEKLGGRLDHWSKGTEAVEGVWRDFYTGELHKALVVCQH